MGLLCTLTACNQQGITQLPTVAAPEAMATSLALTQNAPPDGFDTVSFPAIDDNLTRLSGWRYDMSFEFNGVFSRTPRTLSVDTQAEVFYNQVESERRIVAEIDLTDLREGSSPREYEAVRLGPDVFLVENDRCISNATTETIEVAADLSAGNLLGGVQQASTAAQQAIINGETVWRYTLQPEQVLLPSIDLSSGRIVNLNGELWVSPEHNVVVRYYLTLDIENASLLSSTLPVDGTVLLRYDLYEVGVVPNLNVPFGC